MLNDENSPFPLSLNCVINQKTYQLGQFPLGSNWVVLPLEIFSNVAPGTNFRIDFNVFDGFDWGDSAVSVTFWVNKLPVITIDPPGPLTFPPIGPAEDLVLSVTIVDDSPPIPVARYFQYRFDSSNEWTKVLFSDSFSLTIPKSKFTNHLLWNSNHQIEFVCFDGLEQSSSFLWYNVTESSNTESPTPPPNPESSTPNQESSTSTSESSTLSQESSTPNQELSTPNQKSSTSKSEPSIADNSNSGQLTGGAIAGITVAVVVIVAGIVAGIFYFSHRPKITDYSGGDSELY
jgi:hypothetical protein